MSVLIIGIGNEYRCDDMAGLFVAKEIDDRHLPNVTVKKRTGEGADLIEAWQGFDNVIIADAVSSGARPGTIFRIDASNEALPAKVFNYSTHAFGVVEAIEMARLMNKIPSNVLIYGIEGENFGSGLSISRPVLNASHQVFNEIVKYIKETNHLNHKNIDQ